MACRANLLLLADSLLVVCLWGSGGSGLFGAQPKQEWIRQIYPDYESATGVVPSEGSKVIDVRSVQYADSTETVVLLTRVGFDQEKTFDCGDCPRLVDFALLGTDAKILAFQKGILRMDGYSSLSIVPDEFFRGPHKQVLGILIRRAQQGIESETLYLVDIRPPPRTVLEVQTHFSTCGAPGADETAGTSHTKVIFNARGPYPILLERTRQDCRGHLLDQSTLPFAWDSGVRHFVPVNKRP